MQKNCLCKHLQFNLVRINDIICNSELSLTTTLKQLQTCERNIAVYGLVCHIMISEFDNFMNVSFKDACIAVSGFADSLVETTIKHSDNQSTKRKNMTLEGGEVQKSKQLIEASASVIQKEKELQKARENKALLNQELNKFDKDDNKKLSTEL